MSGDPGKHRQPLSPKMISVLKQAARKTGNDFKTLKRQAEAIPHAGRFAFYLRMKRAVKNYTHTSDEQKKQRNGKKHGRGS